MEKMTAIEYVFKYVTTPEFIKNKNEPIVPQNAALNAIERARKEGYETGVSNALIMAADKAAEINYEEVDDWNIYAVEILSLKEQLLKNQ